MYCLCCIHLIILLLLERENQRVFFLFFLCYFFFSLDENFSKMIIFFCPKIFNFFEIYCLTCGNSTYRSPKNWAFSNRKSNFLPKNHVFGRPKRKVLSEPLSWLGVCFVAVAHFEGALRQARRLRRERSERPSGARDGQPLPKSSVPPMPGPRAFDVLRRGDPSSQG